MNLLARRWPGLAALPYVSIAELPTPLDDGGPSGGLLDGFDEDAEPLFDVHALLTKRDDLTSPAYGGNKVRKLEFLLGDAIARGARSVITFGAYGSNHALATAVHASSLGLEAHVILSPQPPTASGVATVLAHAGIGTQLHCVSDYAQAPRRAAGLRARLRERDGVEPYVIPMGGSSAVGALGYVNAALELADQIEAGKRVNVRIGSWFESASYDVPIIDAVYLAAGTLGTAVGLAVGFAAVPEYGARVEAVRVTPGEIANADRVRELAVETVALLRSHDPSFPALRIDELPLRLRDDQFGEGYAVPTPAAIEAVELAEQGGLHLETTYTGKALAAVVSDARAGLLRHEHVLFWDTYSSAPKPPAGDRAVLPPELAEWVEACEALGS